MEQLQKKLASISAANKEYRNWHTDKALKNEVKIPDEAGFGTAEFLAMGD